MQQGGNGRYYVQMQPNYAPGEQDGLIGAIVLEEIDLLVDCISERVLPHNPKNIIAEIE
jgi:hypothetical protein